MNKYSSKAVKTAATVGMSLAMVLSAMPVLGNTTNTQAAITNVISARTTATKAHNILSAVLGEVTDYADLFATDPISSDTVNVDDKFSFKLSGTLATLGNIQVATGGDSVDGIGNNTTLLELANYLVANSYAMDNADIDEDVIAFAKFIKGYTSAIDTLGDYFESDGTLNATPDYGALITSVATSGVTSSNADDAEAVYNDIKDNEKYLNAVAKEAALKTVEDFCAEVEDYKGENEDVYVKRYVKALEDVIVDGDSTSVYDAVEKEASISYKDLSKVEKALKNIKNDDETTLSAIADYDDVKDAEEVAYYIDGLQTIIDEMKEVKDLLKSTNSEIKAYKKDLATKVKSLSEAIGKYTDTDEDTVVALDKALNAFRESDITELKAFVEDFIGQFFTLTPKQLNSGKYVVRLENADYGRYVTTDDVFNALENDSATIGLQYLLTKAIDNEDSADTYYNQLVNTVTTVEELLKAVTTDIEGLTLNSTLTSAQATKIIKAKKAMNQLVTDGKIADEYASALTSKEKKEVLANEELVETLYFKLILNGSVTASGWVDKGNGDWDYINEDGTRSTKWVAAGSDWYYVKNGTMLRNSWIASDAQGTRWYYVDDAGKMVSNTTVNGYTFNSYGVWVK